MDLQNFKRYDIETIDGDSYIKICFERLEREFTPSDRNLVLYSHIKYSTKDFNWEAVVPTVKIPYKDPSLGFLLNGVVFSSVGVYQRAPGVVLTKDDSEGVDKVSIVTSRNSTLSIEYRRGGIQIGFHRGSKYRYVPIGVFLKALSGLPYEILLKRFAYKSTELLNSFPCSVPDRGIDLSKAPTWGSSSQEEPSIDDCVAAVYAALMQHDSRNQAASYSSQWKLNRIRAFFMGLHFKSVQNYESNMALHARVFGTYFAQDLNIRVFDEDGSAKSIQFKRGEFIDSKVAKELSWYNVSLLRVRAERTYLVQEDTPMLFRALGYKLAVDLPELGLDAGTFVTQDVLKKLNTSGVYTVDFYTPDGRITMSRSGEDPEVGDFFTIVNALITAQFKERSDASQYEVANRVVVDYDRQVGLEVEQVYQDIIGALLGCEELRHIAESLPRLPSTALASHLRDSGNKELTQAETTNVMSRAIAERRASALLRETPVAMTAVQRGQYGRIDSLHSPESNKIGSVQEITAMARINSVTNELEAPYEIVKDGVPTGEIEYVSAAKERNKYVAGWDDELTTRVVMARYNGDVVPVDREAVSYRDVSPFCDMSISRMTIPFPEFSQPRRSIMATKMSGQAIPLLFPERPRVSTGADTEIPCLYYTARQVVETSLGEAVLKETADDVLRILNVKWTKNSAMYTCAYAAKSFVFSVPFLVTDKETLYNYNLNFREGYVYQLDDIVFYNQSCDLGKHEYYERVKQGTLPVIKHLGGPAMALGVNLTVMWKTYMSSTIDDAVVISDRLISNRKLSSIQIFKYEYDLKPGEQFSPVDGIPGLHTHVYTGEPVIRVTKPRGASVVDKYVYATQDGEVIFSEIESASGANAGEISATVWVATFHDADIGDKVAGRHGNKSVIARIVPEEWMPYDPETGESADIICSPLGVPSRMNFGQVVEMTLGAAMMAQGKYAVVTPFYPNIKQEVIDLYNASGLQPKRMYNPVYGKFTERPVMVGCMYFLKLEQIANLKLSAVGYPMSIDPVFGQPVASVNRNKGQAVGEMETWAFIASGAEKVLNDFFSLYSEDGVARERYFSMLRENSDKGPDGWQEQTSLALRYRDNNIDAVVTQTILRMFGLDIMGSEDSSRYQIFPLRMNDIVVDTTALNLKNHTEPVREHEWCKIKLHEPVINPFWVESFPLHRVLGVKSVKALATGLYYLNTYDRSIIPAREVDDNNRAGLITGIRAVIALLQNTTITQAIERLAASGSQQEESDVVTAEYVIDDDMDLPIEIPANVADIVKFLQRMQSDGLELSDLIWDYMPIMPKVFRQTTVTKGVEREHSFQKQLYSICSHSKSDDVYAALRAFIGYGRSNDKELVSLRGYFFGKGSASGQHGTVRGNVLSKRVGFSGRSVIVPTDDITMPPYFVGIPWRAALVELSSVLTIRFKRRLSDMASDLSQDIHLPAAVLESITDDGWGEIIESLFEFNPYVFRNYFPALDTSDQKYLYNYLRSTIKQICESNVRNDGYVKVRGTWVPAEEVSDSETIDAAMVTFGRQPTLHKKSVRCFFMRLVDGYAAHIHPVVCSGFNADFDGDTMWHVQLMGEMKHSAWKSLSVLRDLISEKDGSFTLTLAQDVALGLYCATVFKNNAVTISAGQGEYYFFDDVNVLRTELEYGKLHYYDIVIFYNDLTEAFYISTAGRVLVNAIVPGAFTRIPFSDPYGICRTVLGEEYISAFCMMKYDTVWVATGTRPEGRPDAVKIEQVLLDTYDVYGARTSVALTQKLYEIGLVASDIYSVTTTLDGLSVDVDKTVFMSEPREYVNKLNTLKQMGLVTDNEQKIASARAWERARKAAMSAVVKAIPPDSNTHFLMYSGARGNPDQFMQSVGFIGTISKTTSTDIEYPVLRGYGEGLSSLDLAQTYFMARIGVVSTQVGTQDTGYATRQTVYMSSGMTVKEHDCGVRFSSLPVEYSGTDTTVRCSDGSVCLLPDLRGEFVDPDTEQFDTLEPELTRSGYMITQAVINLVLLHGIEHIKLLDSEVEIKYVIKPEWREFAVRELYSYAVPYTVNGKITEESVDWIQKHGLREAILFDKDNWESGLCFDREAYLPVRYDASKYTLLMGDVAISEEVIYGRSVSSDTEGFHYFKNLLDVDQQLSVKALRYLTKKRVHSLLFEDGRVVKIVYKISDLFKDLVLGRYSIGLPYLDANNDISAETLAEVESLQLEYIPVRTTLTCLTNTGVCELCRGRSLSTKQYSKVGENIGIPAAQAQCEPLSQATLNVTHSGGKRGAGVGLVSGLSYYMQMLKGTLVPKKSMHLLESFAPQSGYVEVNPHDPHYYQVVSESGSVLFSGVLDDPERLAVPPGAFVNAGDTICSGLPQLDRYSTSDIFTSALKTRYLLLEEYHKIFQALHVSSRNYEILAREQTSICYLNVNASLPPMRDTSEEINSSTGKYVLRVASQTDVVNKYSGIAGFAFENVSDMLASGVLKPDGLDLNSDLGNLVTGTPVGSKKALFMKRRGGASAVNYRKSAVKEVRDQLQSMEMSSRSDTLELRQGESQSVSVVSSVTDQLLADLFSMADSIEGGDTKIPELSLGGDSVFVESSDKTEDLEDKPSPVVEETEILDVTFEEIVDESAPDAEDSSESLDESEAKKPPEVKGLFFN